MARMGQRGALAALRPVLIVLGTAPDHNSAYDITQDGPAWLAGLTKIIGAIATPGSVRQRGSVAL
jgi:hypothetical protein